MSATNLEDAVTTSTCLYIIANLYGLNSAAVSQLRNAASMLRQIPELHKFKAALAGIPEVAITAGGWNIEGYAKALKAEFQQRIEGLERQNAELRDQLDNAPRWPITE